MGNFMCVKLKEVRLEKGLTQKKLAELIKCSVYKIRQWENCLASPKLKDLWNLEYVLRVHINYLLGESDIKDIIIVSYFDGDDEFDEKYRYIRLD